MSIRVGTLGTSLMKVLKPQNFYRCGTPIPLELTDDELDRRYKVSKIRKKSIYFNKKRTVYYESSINLSR